MTGNAGIEKETRESRVSGLIELANMHRIDPHENWVRQADSEEQQIYETLVTHSGKPIVLQAGTHINNDEKKVYDMELLFGEYDAFSDLGYVPRKQVVGHNPDCLPPYKQVLKRKGLPLNIARHLERALDLISNGSYKRLTLTQ